MSIELIEAIGVETNGGASGPRGQGGRPPHIVPRKIVLAKIAEELDRIWDSTGFGEMRICSEQIKQDRVRVIVCSGAHHKFVIVAKAGE
jgi:hypothetical protein